MIKKEQAILSIISQSKCSNIIRKKVNKHVGEIKKQLEGKKDKYSKYKQKQVRQFKGQKEFFEGLKITL